MMILYALLYVSSLYFGQAYSTSTVTTLPLFKAFPHLQGKILHLNLGTFPTPLLCNTHIPLPIKNILIKDDGVCAHRKSGIPFFGGNKVRKLEFILADAVARGARTLITFGRVGSNHAVASACYAQKLGLYCVCLLSHQEYSPIVERNLLLHTLYGTELYYFPTTQERNLAFYQTSVNCHHKDHVPPYIIPTGGSNYLGTLGFVNAVFELQEQLKTNSLEIPDYIYVPAGSFGTLAGLMLGIKLANLPIKIMGVCIEPVNKRETQESIKELIHATNLYLHKLDTTIPLFNWYTEDIMLEDQFAGKDYGAATSESEQACKLMLEHAGIILDQVYSAKCFAALQAHAQQGKLNNKTILFWNTFCAHDFSQELAHANPIMLPECFQQYIRY